MQIQDDDRWRFLTFIGRADVNVYDDGSVGFSPLKDGFPGFGGKNWKAAVDSGIRKFVKANLFQMDEL